MENKSVLLMYLGGETTSTNLLEHWTLMNTTFNHKNNFYIVVHPKTIEGYTINDTYLKLFNKDNIFIVDNDHHLKTGWGTHSLTCATLMMMQYANIKYNNKFFDKYVLLSNSCLPLYTLDEIYNEIINDNKSWINGSHIDHHQTGIMRPGLSFLFSQWAILDKQHAKYFFYNNDNDFIRTYNKDDMETVCQGHQNQDHTNLLHIETIKLIDIKDDLDDLYDDTPKSYGLPDDYSDYFTSFSNCIISDETFIGNRIFNQLISNKKEKSINEILIENIRCINNLQMKERLRNVPFDIKLQLASITSIINKDISYIKPITIAPFNLESDNSENKLYSNINYFNYTISHIEDPITNTYITVLPTYLDFFSFGTAPNNIIRDFKVFALNVNEYLNRQDKLIALLEDMKLKVSSTRPEFLCKSEIDNSNSFKNITNPIHNHPVEYDCWTLRNMLNTYVFLITFKCFIINEPPQENSRDLFKTMTSCFHLYQKIIFREFNIDQMIYKYDIIYSDIIYESILSELDRIIVSPESPDLNKKFGTFITNNTLLSAFSNGSLFIRKCHNESLIEKYSEILKKWKYNNQMIEHNVPIKTELRNAYDITNHKKYIKYKNKYLKLKKYKI